MNDLYSDKRFLVENAFNLYATSFVTIPAKFIYDDHMLNENIDVIKNCHIYMIGLLPKIYFLGAKISSGDLEMNFRIATSETSIILTVGEEITLINNPEEGYALIDSSGQKFWPSKEFILRSLQREGHEHNFEVLYIGQAFGSDGSRSALDRLRKHETLQKISLLGIPDGYELSILMLEVIPDNRIMTFFNPFAKEDEQSDSRIADGLDKLFETDEPEKTTLFEAAMIRYFQPRFNKEFKDSFPSTNLKVLAQCYKKDFSAIIAEICIDEMPFRLFSEKIAVKDNHIVVHNLHTEEDRNVFFL